MQDSSTGSSETTSRLSDAGVVGSASSVAAAGPSRKTFHLELIKPSHYDDDGYVIQWAKAWIPSNSLSSVYGLAQDIADRGVLGADIELEINAYDETHTIIPIEEIADRVRRAQGLVCLIGVQTNQFPRALDIARQLRSHQVQVAIGGFHVSGVLSMLPAPTPELIEAQELGISLFAGEAEGRLEQVIGDALRADLKPLYNFMADLPDLGEQPTPFLPAPLVQKYAGELGCFDAGRGCPFTCSFCTIINVQGRKSRYRSADDVERLIRENAAQGIVRYFITDDNFARNKNWEAIFDRIIAIRESEGINTNFVIQVDTLSHKIPNFVEKAALAGCKRVFIGLENINPESLKSASKGQNKITEYRKMLLAWREQGVITYCGYILGFPGDTPESIERDIEIIKRELPVDMLEFFVLTPLPGSQDHQKLYQDGVPMDPDLNIYDLEHVTTAHPTMSKQTLQAVYDRCWHQYYDWDHVQTLLKRAIGSGIKPARLAVMIFNFYAAYKYERVHPLQSGLWRRKVRTQRRYGMKLESPLVFYPRRALEVLCTYLPAGWYLLRLSLLRKRLQRDKSLRTYTDTAISLASEADETQMELFSATDSAKNALEKRKKRDALIQAAKQRTVLEGTTKIKAAS